MSTQKKIVNILLKSVGAGMCISIGMYAFLQLSTIIGSFVFSIGLLSIFTLGLYLYTGLVPYADHKDIPFLITVLLGNIVGCCVMLMFPSEEAIYLAIQKLSEPLHQVLLQAILCNVLIYVAVEANKKNNMIIIILSVATFILCGFEHSIANISLFISARHVSTDVFLYITTCVVGNAIGGLFIRKVHVGIDENCKDRKRLFE